MSAKQNQHALVYSEGSAENYRRVEATDAITEGAGSRRIEQIVAFPWQASWTESHQENGTTPTLPAGQSPAVAFSAGNHESSYGIGLSVEHTPPLRAGESGTNQVPTIAFSSKDHGADAAQDVAPTLRAMAHRDSHVNGGGQLAVAFAQNQRGEVRDLDNRAGALGAEPGMKQQTYITTPSVRRLTPLECERLQGFPDGWTDIPGNSDTQRYRQLGNAVAVPVVEWLLRRIVEVPE